MAQRAEPCPLDPRLIDSLDRGEAFLSRKARIGVSRDFLFKPLSTQPELPHYHHGYTPYGPLSRERDPRPAVRVRIRVEEAPRIPGWFSCEERATCRCFRRTAPERCSREKRFVIQVPGSAGEKFGLFPVSQRGTEERQRDSGKGSFLGSPRLMRVEEAGEKKALRGSLLCDSKSRKCLKHSGTHTNHHASEGLGSFEGSVCCVTLSRPLVLSEPVSLF